MRCGMQSGCEQVAALGPLVQVRGRGLGAARTGAGSRPWAARTGAFIGF